MRPARRPAIVGVINLSPESNVPGSHAAGLAAVRERAAALCADGADFVELGARSISPDRALIDDAEEWRRLRPALDALVGAGYRVAVDTWSEACATAALAGGACLVNFTGAWPSAELCRAVAVSDAWLCVLYLPYADPYRMRASDPAPYRVADILDRFRALRARARSAGLDRLVLDPNLGIFHPSFDDAAKIAYQVQAMGALPAVARLGCPTLAYLARKSALTSRQLIAAHLAALGVDYVRAHEPAIAVRAWELHAALQRSPATNHG
jgi:dihydropteroate synthase